MIIFRWTTQASLVILCTLCIHTTEAFSASQLHLHQNEPIHRIPTWSRLLFHESSHMTVLQMAEEDQAMESALVDIDRPNITGGENLAKKLGIDQRSLGILVLLTVPLAWGTYGPVVRFLYAIQPPVPGFVFSAGYYGVAAVTMMSLLATQKSGAGDVAQNSDGDDDSQSTAALSSMPFQGGLELGSYLFIGNCLQIVGLKTVESDRAGFLVQLTTILVPILEGILAGNLLAVPARTWLSCALAFCGVSVMNFDSEGMSSIFQALTSFTQGDIEILAAAFCYTLHVVRLGRYARETTPLQLAASKATVEFFLSSSVVLALLAVHDDSGSTGFVAESAAEISNFFSSFSTAFSSGTLPMTALVSALGATLWTGWITCAYTIYAQSFGQQRVNPTDANLIYSIQPIFTALFAFLLLGETMDGTGVIGGTLIGAGILLVATDITDDSDADNEDGSGGRLISTVQEPSETKERVAVSASKIGM